MCIRDRGDTVEALGLVLSGGVNIESVDVWGSRSILGHVCLLYTSRCV